MRLNTYLKSGIGLTIIGLGFGLPYVQFLDLDFSTFPSMVLTLIQIGFIIMGIGLMITEQEE